MHTQINDLHSNGARRNKVVSAQEAVRLIHDGDTIATGGFIGIGFAPLRDNDTPSGAFDRADKAVYYAKGHGRNQICSYTALVEAGELLEQSDGAEEVDFF